MVNFVQKYNEKVFKIGQMTYWRNRTIFPTLIYQTEASITERKRHKKNGKMKLITTLAAVLLVTLSFGQLGISTDFRQDGYWDNEKEEWNITSTDEGGTLFEFNRELTTFKHTTESITSTYYIKDWKYDEDGVKYTMQITSDAGNDYEMIVDGVNNCVAFFYYRDDVYYLVRHTIKNTWFNEEDGE